MKMTDLFHPRLIVLARVNSDGCDLMSERDSQIKVGITPAADIFGLGVTLYELLTGKLPFPEMGKGDPYPQILQAPSSIRRHRPAVPVGLEKLVLSCLSRDPKARPNLAALLPSLHRYITSGPPIWPKGFDPEA